MNEERNVLERVDPKRVVPIGPFAPFCTATAQLIFSPQSDALYDSLSDR